MLGWVLFETQWETYSEGASSTLPPPPIRLPMLQNMLHHRVLSNRRRIMLPREAVSDTETHNHCKSLVNEWLKVIG
ncbi:hypothetical protein Ocin01_13057 [Orchesella cincta]|uniref:Uncharacterized protein n=1 Tax=Orchesella cincta TaxID=48709 RepID=A0A1D2MKX8_ORCCI|nr:hypothetical protein Ocin01_13057 [Orchesella cincta]